MTQGQATINIGGAQINADGTIAAQSGILTSVTRKSVGTYAVVFTSTTNVHPSEVGVILSAASGTPKQTAFNADAGTMTVQTTTVSSTEGEVFGRGSVNAVGALIDSGGAVNGASNAGAGQYNVTTSADIPASATILATVVYADGSIFTIGAVQTAARTIFVRTANAATGGQGPQNVAFNIAILVTPSASVAVPVDSSFFIGLVRYNTLGTGGPFIG